jgi:hypothetical protein
MEEFKRHCEICDIDFNRTRDYDKHIKTNKHIKKMFENDKTKCPYCDYKSIDNSNMNKHIKSQHKETKLKINKAIEKEDKIHKNIIKAYLTLKESKASQVIKLSAFKCRFNRLKGRGYDDKHPLIIDVRLNYSTTFLDFKNTDEKIKELLNQYPELIKEELPAKNIDINNDDNNDNDDNDDNDNSKQEENKKYEKINSIKNEIELLVEEYKKSKGDKTILNKIYEKENELKNY